MSPTLENMENCLKTWHRPRQNLSKRSKYAELLRFKVGQKGDIIYRQSKRQILDCLWRQLLSFWIVYGDMQQHKIDNNKKAETPQQLKTNYCGPLDTEST